MNAQQPVYRFPTLDHAHVWREIIGQADPHAAGIINRTAAAVLIAVPHLDPIATVERLWDAVDGLVVYTSCPQAERARLRLRAMMAGLAIVAAHDDPPPEPQAMAA